MSNPHNPLQKPLASPSKNNKLTPCKDCGKSVSKNAKTCPHCGVDHPGYVPIAKKPAQRAGRRLSNILIRALFGQPRRKKKPVINQVKKPLARPASSSKTGQVGKGKQALGSFKILFTAQIMLWVIFGLFVVVGSTIVKGDVIFNYGTTVIAIIFFTSFLPLLFWKRKTFSTLILWAFGTLIMSFLVFNSAAEYLVSTNPQFAAELEKQEAEAKKRAQIERRAQLEKRKQAEKDRIKHSFDTQNKVRSSPNRRRDIGEKIIDHVKDVAVGHKIGASIYSFTVEDAFPPHKVQTEFMLKKRINEEQLGILSKAVKQGAGSGFDRYFVGFSLEGDTGGYWASAHHDPKLEVKLLGLSAKKYDALVDRVANYKPNKSEQIIADAIMSHGFTYHLVILKRGKKYIVRRYHDSGAEWEKNGDPIPKKGGRYWEVDNSFGENFIVRGGYIEIHDKSGLITKAKITKRQNTLAKQEASPVIKSAVEKCSRFPETIERKSGRTEDEIFRDLAHTFEVGRRSRVSRFKLPVSNTKKLRFMRSLYTQLQKVRKNKSFKRYGFASNPGKTWQAKVESLRKDDGAFARWLLKKCGNGNSIYCTDRSPTSLLMLGRSYQANRGKETQATCRDRIAWDKR